MLPISNEAVEIRKHKVYPGKGLSIDFGAYLKSNTCAPVLDKS
jgi:hypothetical protein